MRAATVRRQKELTATESADWACPASNPEPIKTAKSFRTLFCEFFHCSLQEYEHQLFVRCLHRHALPVAGILSRISPEFFREDAGFMCDLATACSREEVLTELNRFHGRNVRDQNWLRKTFSLRISGKRVQRLSRKLFTECR